MKVKVTVPEPTPLTTPALVTVAIAGLLLVQVPPLVGDKVVDEPIQMVDEPVTETTGSPFTVTAGVGAEAQPVAVLVKVKVAEPADKPVTTPPLVTLATPGALLLQVPPVVGESVVIDPTQILFTPVILTTGAAFTVTGEVGTDAQPVSELVKIKVTEPADTPVTTPALVTVAMAGLLLAHVPPVVGDSVVVDPTQILVAPVILAVGRALTETGEVGADTHPVVVLVNVKVTVPADTPVTTPALVTVATDGLLLTHVPPVTGVSVVVDPTQILLPPEMLTTGMALTVTGEVAEETQPVLVLVKVNVAVPAETPVTTPVLVTVATAGLLLVQVPPLVGESVVVAPTHIDDIPVILTTGMALTVTGSVGVDIQPVIELVNVKVTDPADTPVTIPLLVTVAMAGLLLDHTPPVVGDKVVLAPTQMLLPPVMLTTGSAFTVTAEVAGDTHPVDVLVNVKVAEPAETPVTTPALVTVATNGSLLVQVPPVDGDKVVVEPTQIVDAPVNATTGVP